MGLSVHHKVTDSGEIPIETVEMTQPLKLISRIADPKLPFGGTWTFEIMPTEGGSTLRITENGYVTNPVFRFLSRFVFWSAGSIGPYLNSLTNKLDEQPTIAEEAR